VCGGGGNRGDRGGRSVGHASLTRPRGAVTPGRTAPYGTFQSFRSRPSTRARIRVARRSVTRIAIRQNRDYFKMSNRTDTSGPAAPAAGPEPGVGPPRPASGPCGRAASARRHDDDRGRIRGRSWSPLTGPESGRDDHLRSFLEIDRASTRTLRSQRARPRNFTLSRTVHVNCAESGGPTVLSTPK